MHLQFCMLYFTWVSVGLKIMSVLGGNDAVSSMGAQTWGWMLESSYPHVASVFRCASTWRPCPYDLNDLNLIGLIKNEMLLAKFYTRVFSFMFCPRPTIGNDQVSFYSRSPTFLPKATHSHQSHNSHHRLLSISPPGCFPPP